MIYQLKILPEFFDAAADAAKACEVRRADRPFCVGDTLALLEWSPGGGYTGRSCTAAVIHILRHEDFPDGVPEGYAVISVKIADAGDMRLGLDHPNI